MHKRIWCALTKHNWIKSWRTKYDETIVVSGVECSQCGEQIDVQ